MYNIQNIKDYFNLIEKLKTFNFKHNQYFLINKKLKVVSQELDQLIEPLSYQLADNSSNYQLQIEELNNLDQKYPLSNNNDYFDLLKNKNNLNLKNKKQKIITQHIKQIEDENKLLINTINNCQKYINLPEITSENDKNNIQQELKKFFIFYQRYFLLNFINYQIINNSIKNIQYDQKYHLSKTSIFIEFAYLLILFNILIFILTSIFYHY